MTPPPNLPMRCTMCHASPLNFSYRLPAHMKMIPPPPPPESTACHQIRDISMRYRENLPPVLQGLTVSIEGGSRVGVVGRTGAGKSSLIAALFRMVELDADG